MDLMARTQAERVYEDFEPRMEWARAPGDDTLIVYLPGFMKEQLKVQVTTARNLRLSGERHIDGKRWNRFRTEIPIPSNYDTNGIGAKFEKGILYVKHPKIELPQEKIQQPVEPPRTPDKEQPPPEASIPGPKRATVEEKLEPSGEAPPRPQDQSTEAKTPQQEKVQPPPEAAVPLKPRQEIGQPSRELSYSRTEEKPSTENFDRTTSQRTEHDQPAPDSILGAAEKDIDSVKGAGKFESEFDGFIRKFIWRGLLTELNEPSKLINLVLGILLVVVTVLYAMTALRSPSKSEN